MQECCGSHAEISIMQERFTRVYCDVSWIKCGNITPEAKQLETWNVFIVWFVLSHHQKKILLTLLPSRDLCLSDNFSYCSTHFSGCRSTRHLQMLWFMNIFVSSCRQCLTAFRDTFTCSCLHLLNTIEGLYHSRLIYKFPRSNQVWDLVNDKNDIPQRSVTCIHFQLCY